MDRGEVPVVQQNHDPEENRGPEGAVSFAPRNDIPNKDSILRNLYLPKIESEGQLPEQITNQHHLIERKLKRIMTKFSEDKSEISTVFLKKTNMGIQARGQTHPVEQKKANRLGLYDMSGNVWEQCEACYDGSSYKNSPKDDPKGPNNGKFKVVRGGT